MKATMKWIIEEKYDGMLVRDYLKLVRAFSRRMVKIVKFQTRGILVNGQDVTVRHLLAAGDELVIIFPDESRGEFMFPKEIGLDIVYEDDDVMVINKQAGIATIPSRHHPEVSIANGLVYYYEQKGLPFTVHVVTRLDRDTTGLLLIAKHRFSHSLLAAGQKAKTVKRKYYAIVEGKLEKKEDTINAPIDRKKGSIIERAVVAGGQEAITHYQVLEEKDGFSLLKVELETGRTHQIRVHFSNLGHPLLGDDLYGGHLEDIHRQALHCFSLTFEHPTTKKLMHFEVDLPEDMKRVLNR